MPPETTVADHDNAPVSSDAAPADAATSETPSPAPGHRAPATRAPFFIVGSDRSGTTMLRLMLDRAPDGPAVPPETMFITDYLHVFKRGGLDDHKAAVDFTKRVWNHPRVDLWELDGEPELPPKGLSHEEAFRWGVSQPFIAYMHRDGKTWWADKTPPHIDHVDDLKKVFPDATFVELVRDGRDVALSIMGLPFGGNNVWVTGLRWASVIRKGRAAHAKYPGEIITVRYEDLCTQPEVELRRLCEFLGLRFDPDMLAVEKTDMSKLQKDQLAWFSNLWAGINQSAMGKWRKKMPPGDQAVYLAAAGPELALHGYDLGDVEPASPSTFDAARFQTTNMGHRLVNLVKLRIIKERGRELGWVIARRLRRP